MRALYQEEYFRGEEYADYLRDKPIQLKTLRQHLTLLQKWVAPGARVLEVGCAYGFFLQLLDVDYPGSVGIDVCKDAIQFAAESGWDAREATICEMPLAETFDAVCMWDTLEHLAEPLRVMETAWNLLERGGYVVLTTGDIGAWLSRVQGRRWRQIHPPTHLYYYTRPALQALCERVGFEVVRFGTVKIYRRIGSMLHALAKLGDQRFVQSLAKVAQVCLPSSCLERDIGIDLRDTLYLVARKPFASEI